MDTNARVSILENWREFHDKEQGALWKKANAAYDKALKLEATMAVYAAVGGGLGGVAGAVVGALVVWFITRGHV